MKKTLYLYLIGCLALLPAAEASTVLMDLSPVDSGTTGLNANGITPADVWGYDLMSWHAVWEKSALANQVAFSAGAVSLQVGGAASQNTGGNFAGLKFSLAPAAAPSALSFDIARSSTWGSAQFECTYTCDIYGFAADGSSTVIGTWSLADAVDNLSSDGMHVSIDLNMGDASYDSYGLIFNAYKSGSQSGGMAASITNLQISGEMVPEPATASLGLIGLAAMLMRRRRG